MAEREIDREIDRKKKEQESAEMISGLKTLLRNQPQIKKSNTITLDFVSAAAV